MASGTLQFQPPLKGESDSWARSQQPPLTSPGARNVLPVDRTGRLRIGSRPGLTKHYPAALPTGAARPIGLVVQTTYVDGSGDRQTPIICVAGTKVYVDGTEITGHTLTDGAIVTAACVEDGQVILCDGGQYLHVLDLQTSPPTLAHLTATSGTVPEYAGTCCYWRGRLVLGGPDHTWYMSRAGCYTDWNYGAHDASRAVNGENANSLVAGQISDPILMLAPVSEDTLLVGHDQRMTAFRGDPTSGAIIDVSNHVGALTATAWTRGPGGCYFVGTGGLYQFNGEGLSQIGTELGSYFTDLDRTRQRITLLWDRERGGLWLFVTEIERACSIARVAAVVTVTLSGHGYAAADQVTISGATETEYDGVQTIVAVTADTFTYAIATTPTTPATGSPLCVRKAAPNVGLFYHAGTAGSWRQTFPDGMSPTAVGVYDGDLADDRRILLGGRDGQVRYLDDAVASDDGTAISSYLDFGPYLLSGPLADAKILSLDLAMGDTPDGFTDEAMAAAWTLSGGADALDTATSPEQTSTGVLAGPGRQVPVGLRFAANTLILRVANSTLDKLWSFDWGAARVMAGGRHR
jgi:hypothetical protein